MPSQVEHAPMVASAFADKVKDKIQAAVIELIPDEQWKGMIEAEINRFMQPRSEYGKNYPAPLTKMIRDEIDNVMRERLQESLKSGELRPVWDPDKGVDVTQDMVREAVKENAPELMAALLSNLMASTLSEMQRRLGDVLNQQGI